MPAWHDLSIPFRPNGQNPRCYWAEPPMAEPVVADGFIGAVALGGSVNHQKVTFMPHGTGTHTECYGHVSADTDATLANYRIPPLLPALLVTASPGEKGFVCLEDVEKNLPKAMGSVKALIIRTLPNGEDKKTRDYSGTNPPYLHHDLAEMLVKLGIEHLITDLPSVDPEVDGGALRFHKTFWQMEGHIRRQATITELAYIPDSVPDGVYTLNLQVPNWELDAAPSRPVIWRDIV